MAADSIVAALDPVSPCSASLNNDSVTDSALWPYDFAVAADPDKASPNWTTLVFASVAPLAIRSA